MKFFSVKSLNTKNAKLASFSLDKIRFFIHKKVKTNEEFPFSEDHFEFEVKNVDEEVQKLVKEGFKLIKEPKNYFWGRSAFLRDPEKSE